MPSLLGIKKKISNKFGTVIIVAGFIKSQFFWMVKHRDIKECTRNFRYSLTLGTKGWKFIGEQIKALTSHLVKTRNFDTLEAYKLLKLTHTYYMMMHLDLEIWACDTSFLIKKLEQELCGDTETWANIWY